MSELNAELLTKYQRLRDYLAELDSVAVAFSAGVDSTLLLWVAHDVLGEKAVAVTARSATFPRGELRASADFCACTGIEQVFVDTAELDSAEFCANPPDRCYLCKSELFAQIWQLAHQRGLAQLVEGSNLDDLGDYRPGLKAMREQGVLSPLREAGLSKCEVRELSRYLGLATHDKPSLACLASRFPYGQALSPEGLAMVEQAEQLLLDLGCEQVRVRNHAGLARIETDAAGFALITDAKVRQQIDARFRRLGFTYVSLDLSGYRSGSMNEALAASKR